MLCPLWDPIVFTIVEYVELELSKKVLILFINKIKNFLESLQLWNCGIHLVKTF